MRLTLTLVLAGLACSIAAGPALADSNTKVDLFDEAGADVGFLNYSQGPSGDLRLVAAIKGADPGSFYRLSVECGAEDDYAGECELGIDLGAVATNDEGNGSSGAEHVSVEALREAFGAGGTLVHVELGRLPGGGCLVASGISLLIPGPLPVPEGMQS